MKKICYVAATSAVAKFSELLARAHYGSERIILTKHGVPLVELVPVKGERIPRSRFANREVIVEES